MKKLDTVSFIIVNYKEYLNIHNILTKQNPFRAKTHDFNQKILEA
jgi:bifunctional DNase/RNase